MLVYGALIGVGLVGMGCVLLSIVCVGGMGGADGIIISGARGGVATKNGNLVGVQSVVEG